MRVWIDATHHDGDLAVFGMSLVERALRALLSAQSGLRRLEQAEARLQELSYTQTRLEEFLRDKMRPKEVRIELAQNTASELGDAARAYAVNVVDDTSVQEAIDGVMNW